MMNAGPVPPTADERPSPISLRIVAAVVDYTIVMVLVVIAIVVGDQLGSTQVGNVIGLALIAAYPIVLIALRDRTIGKQLCSLVVRATNGGRPGWWRSIVRFTVTALPFVIGTAVAKVDGRPGWLPSAAQIVLSAAVYLPILFDDQRRGLHDRIAGTHVDCTAPPLASITEQLAARANERGAQP